VDVVTANWKEPYFTLVDVNGDQHPDIIMQEGNMDDNFWHYRAYPGESVPQYPAVGYVLQQSRIVGSTTLGGRYFHSADLNGDGIIDLVSGSGDWPWVSVPHIYYGRGDGTFETTVAPIAVSDYQDQVSFADFNLDGAMDAIWTNYHCWGGSKPRTWMNIGDRQFQDQSTQLGIRNQFASSRFYGYVADFNGDGALDLVSKADNGTYFDIYRNNAALQGKHRLQVVPVGVHSAADGTGARIEVTVGGKVLVQECLSDSMWGGVTNSHHVKQYFGLGKRLVRTEWWCAGRAGPSISLSE
jgi:hypothetical protein